MRAGQLARQLDDVQGLKEADAEVRALHAEARADAEARGDHSKLALVSLRERMWAEAIAEPVQGVQPPVTALQRQHIALKLASPHRAPAGCVIRDQEDAGHLPLFIAGNEPSLFGERLA